MQVGGLTFIYMHVPHVSVCRLSRLTSPVSPALQTATASCYCLLPLKPNLIFPPFFFSLHRHAFMALDCSTLFSHLFTWSTRPIYFLCGAQHICGSRRKLVVISFRSHPHVQQSAFKCLSVHIYCLFTVYANGTALYLTFQLVNIAVDDLAWWHSSVLQLPPHL